MRSVPFLEYLEWGKDLTNKSVSYNIYGAFVVFMYVLAVVLPFCIPLLIYKLL